MKSTGKFLSVGQVSQVIRLELEAGLGGLWRWQREGEHGVCGRVVGGVWGCRRSRISPPLVMCLQQGPWQDGHRAGSVSA